MIRSNVEFVSNLPLFETSPSKDFPEFLLVRCPREDCVSYKDARPFLVHKRTWLRPRKTQHGDKETVIIFGRVCPYCHKVSRPPKGRRRV